MGAFDRTVVPELTIMFLCESKRQDKVPLLHQGGVNRKLKLGGGAANDKNY